MKIRRSATVMTGEVRSVLRVSELDDTASVHEAGALDIEADIRSGATAPGMDAPALHSAVSPPQPPPRVEFGLLGGADRPPQPAVPIPRFVATEAIVTPALAGTSSLRLQPVDPLPVPSPGPFDSGLHHASETVQPPPVTATASSTAPAPVAARPTGAGVVAPPPAADPRRIRPPRIGGGPRPVAFDPWSAPPGPSSQAASTETYPLG